MTDRPRRPPGEWNTVAATGLGNVSGSPVTLAMLSVDDAAGPWTHPEQMWRGRGWLYWVECWVNRSLDGSSDVAASYRRSVVEPPSSLFDDVLDLADGRDPMRIVSSWGPLGLCSCGWAGQRLHWWNSLHEPHRREQTFWTTQDGTETAVFRGERLSTWTQFGARAWDTCRLVEDVRSGTKNSEAAKNLGRAWYADRPLRDSVIDLEKSRWDRLVASSGDTEWAQGLTRWVARRVIQERRRICANQECHALFEPDRNRHYCEKCRAAGVPAKLAKRRQRNSRA